MNSPDTPDPAQHHQRLTTLEELFTHLQKLVQDLNGVVLDQQRQLDLLAHKLDRAMSDWQTLASRLPEEPRSLEDDKPPHY